MFAVDSCVQRHLNTYWLLLLTRYGPGEDPRGLTSHDDDDDDKDD
jgi:hypothetical protein